MIKKRFRTLISVLLAFSICVSSVLPVSAISAFVDDVPLPNPNTLEFSKDDPWYSRAVYFLYYAHVVDSAAAIDEKGCTLYRPNCDITRKQFLTFLGRLAKECGKEIEQESEWELTMEDCVRWAVANRILFGKGADLAEDDALTRQEMVVFLVRFADYMELETGKSNQVEDLNEFVDSTSVSNWAKMSFEEACQLKIIIGEKRKDGNRALFPQRTATRAEAAQAVYNYVLAADIQLPFYGGDLVNNIVS